MSSTDKVAYDLFRDDPECGPEYSMVLPAVADRRVAEGTHERVCGVLTHVADPDMVLVKRKDIQDGSR